MTKKIYLETLKKCPGSLHFPLLLSKNVKRAHDAEHTTRVGKKKRKHE